MAAGRQALVAGTSTYHLALHSSMQEGLARFDEVWVPSHWGRDVYISAGVNASKIHVIPSALLAMMKKFLYCFIRSAGHEALRSHAHAAPARPSYSEFGVM